MTAVPLLAADGDHAGTGQQGDSPHVMMRMLTAEADVAERPLARPDAVGEPAPPGKGDREGQGAAGLTGVCDRFGSAPCSARRAAPAGHRRRGPARDDRPDRRRPGRTSSTPTKAPGGLSLHDAPHCARRVRDEDASRLLRRPARRRCARVTDGDVPARAGTSPAAAVNSRRRVPMGWCPTGRMPAGMPRSAR